MLHTLRTLALLPPLLAFPAWAQSEPAAAQPANDAAAANPAKSVPTVTTADELLTALESADKDLTTLESDLVYTKSPNELVGGSSQVRKGKLWFFARPVSTPVDSPAGTPPPPPQTKLFQIEFTTLEIDNARRDDRQIWIFDGTWLVEKNFETRLVHRRQVVKPGEKADPLAIGEGPLPIPIGQKREKIVQRFDATLPAPTEGAPELAHKLLADTYQLHLKPKRGTQEARDFQEVRIWYRKQDLLPRLARATHKDGSVTEILLSSMSVNRDLSETVFDTRTPPGWNEQVDDFRQAQGADE